MVYEAGILCSKHNVHYKNIYYTWKFAFQVNFELNT